MSKIKNLMEKMSSEIKELGKKFPLTMVLIAFVTILFTIAIDQDFSRNTEEILEKIYLFCIIWGIGTIFTEIFFVKKSNKILGYGLTGGISFIFTKILTANMTQNTNQIATTLRLLAAYSLILILISIYKSIQNEQLTLPQSTQKVFRDFFNTTTMYIILNIGIMILATIFVQLILDGHYGSVMERLLVLLFGLFYVPSMVYTFSGISKTPINSFIKGLILYVLLPLVTIAIAIIYVYIAKIILLRDMPQNTIYRILAGIFIAAFPVWNMASNYADEKKMIGKITKLLPLLYTPFILLEIYSIGTRIVEIGITPMRYMTCLLIVFHEIVIGLTFYQKGQKVSQSFWYAALLIFISFVTPLHYENVSNWSQKGRIEKIMATNSNFEELSSKDKDRVKSAYEYLQYNGNSQNWIPETLSEETKNQIEEYTNLERKNYERAEYVYLDCKLELNIEEYSKIKYVNGENEDEQKAIIKLQDSERTIDLQEKVTEVISKNKIYDGVELEEDFKQHNIIKISDTEDFYISHLGFSYYEISKTFNYLRVVGYILER